MCGVTFKLPLTPHCLLGCWWIISLVLIWSGLGNLLHEYPSTWMQFLLSISTFILLESLPFSNWNGPFSSNKLSLASFEPPKALVGYIVSWFGELNERKRRKWKLWISVFLSLICVEESAWTLKLDSMGWPLEAWISVPR